jgi:SsrA-binding protein
MGHIRCAMARAKEASGKLGGDRTVAANRRAGHDFELGERYEAGLVLQGSEVRSLRENGADLSEAWVDVTKLSTALVKGMSIPSLKHALVGHLEKRPRKLLLHASEIERLLGSQRRDGMSLVVTRCYFKGGRAKIEFSVAKGRKHHDKRHAIRDKVDKREARQAVARGRRGE